LFFIALSWKFAPINRTGARGRDVCALGDRGSGIGAVDRRPNGVSGNAVAALQAIMVEGELRRLRLVRLTPPDLGLFILCRLFVKKGRGNLQRLCKTLDSDEALAGGAGDDASG
jgi:hypothetical protein